MTVIIISALVAGCTSSSKDGAGDGTNDTVSRANKGVVENDDTPRVGGKLVYGLYSETNGWNPALNQWAPSGLQVTHAIFDTVTAYDENSEIKPFLAKSFDHNADFTEWTFELRPNIKLHNGKPVTAETVVRNQNFLMKSPITGPAYTYSNVTSITTKDELRFVVKLSKGAANWPIALATQLGVVADPDWLESNDGLRPIGTGPFVFDKWEIDKQLTVRKNNEYWQVDRNGTRLPYLDSVDFRVITDTESRSKSLQANDIDVAETLSGKQLQDFQSSGDYQVYSDSKGESRELLVMLNTMVEPFTDPEVRKALVYATDKKSFSDLVSLGFDEVANGPMAPNSPWYAKTDYPQYDPAKARELVDRAKARHGGKIEFTLQGGADQETQVGAQALQQQWADVGIEVKVDLQESAKVIIGVVAGSYQAVMWNQFDSPNPFADGVWWDPRGAKAPPEFTLNFARNKDDTIGAALEEGGATPDIAKQRQAFAVVQQRLAEDVPYVWLSHQRVSLIASKRVVNLVRATLPDGSQGLDMHQGAHQLAQVWMKD